MSDPREAHEVARDRAEVVADLRRYAGFALTTRMKGAMLRAATYLQSENRAEEQQQKGAQHGVSIDN